MSFEYTEITDQLYVENKEQTGEEDYIMVRAKQYADVPISIPNWEPLAHCYTDKFQQYEKDLLEFEVFPDDVWVASYPKSGTTWCQEMVWLICNDLNFEAARAESLRTRFPFLDVSLIHDKDMSSFELVRQTARPRFIKTHLPVSMLPKQYWKVKPKTVYIKRNPKSVAVSYFHHSRAIFYRGSMDTFVRSFMREHQFYSPYHAHVIEYHELHGCDNILYLSFEDMKRELPKVVRKVCQFFGKSYSDRQFEELYEHLSFKSMRENKACNYEDRTQPREEGQRFIRKGELESWKEELTPELIELLDQWTVENDEGKKVVEEVVEAVEEVDKPAYSDEDLETLVGFIRGMIILFDYEDDDFNEEVAETIKLWLTDVNNPLLFIFYDGNRLSASLAFPLCPINDLMYFMREPEQLFNVLECFHDDILFGTLHGDIEGSLLVQLEQVYGPMILSNVDWSENVKANVINGFNAFMTYLTELHYKLSGFTLLYVPREGCDMEIQEVVLNRSMIKRLEAVVIDWTGQIRATLSDTQHFVPDDLVCPSDEYTFWLYRHEVLSAIRLQYKGPNVQHIVRILELAQSLYIKHLKDVLEDLDKEIEIAESNIPFLKLLVDPCFAIGTLETADDFCSQLIYVMHIIRFIGQDSNYLNKDESITKLFLYLSNEIVACCMRGIDIDRILAGAPRYGIEVCRMKINCCESYKIIYEEMLEHFKGEFTWNLDYAAIFNRINAFLQRLNDIMEVCDAMLIFGKYAESTAYTSYRFFCNNAQEFERRCDQVEKIFHNALETIESVGSTILDINNKDWYRYIGEFREMLKSLDDIIENLLSNVFLMSENLEEKLNVLVTLLNFYKRENIRESFMRKIGEVWNILNDEIMQLSKDISAGITEYPALLPPNAGRYAVLKMRFDHLTHLRTLIVNCRFFPEYPQQDEVLALYEACEKQVKAALKGFSESWNKSITTDMASWYQRNLICRSNLRPGLFEVNIERRLLVFFDEAYYFKTLGVNVPMSLDLEKHENTRLTFDNVLRLVLYFNGVISSISDKERLFFKPMIQQTERKLEPLRSKLTWEEDLSEFIEGYVVNVRELLDLIELYKRENHKISTLVERIYSMIFVRFEQQHPVNMTQLMDSVAEQKKKVFTELLEVLTEVSQNIFTVYDSLGSNIRKMGTIWEQYLHKIDKLLKAAIFTCTLNTLRGVQASLENVHSCPILMIEILLKKEGAVYEPSVEAVEQTLRRLAEEVSLTIRPVPSMARRYQLNDGERNFYLQLLEHPDYIEITNSIDETINQTVQLLRTYQSKWNVFRPFWCVDKAAFIERFKLTAMTSEAFQKNIEKFEELQNQLSTQGDFVVCRSVEIDALKLKYALTSHIAEWQTNYIDYLKCIAYGKIIDFNNVLKKNVEELRHEPMEVYELKQLEERYQVCFEELPVKEQEIGIILKYFEVLENYVADLLPEAYELRRNIVPIWAQYQSDLKAIREQIENYQDQFKLSMTGAADALKVDALQMLKMLREEMPTSEDSTPDEAFEAIDRLMMQLEVLERREREIEERMRLLGVDYVRLPALREIRSKLENLRQVWILVQEWRIERDRIMAESYRTADEIELNILSGHFRQCYENLAEGAIGTEAFDVFLRVGEEISHFCITATIVCTMRASFMQDRHWLKVTEIAKCEEEGELLGEQCSFHVMTALKLYNYEEELLNLCFAARKEHEVELDLEAVALRVRAIEFGIRQTAGATGFLELRSPASHFTTLADNIGIINRIRRSPHRHPFQSLIDYWEHTLGLLDEMLEIIVRMESECRTLHELHRITRSTARGSKMDDFNDGFRECFAQWCELMRYISAARLVEDVCPVGQEFIGELESVRKRLNQQANALNDVLCEQREVFPRFYFLSDNQLIRLISAPLDFTQLEQSLPILYENVARFHLLERGKLSAPSVGGVYTRDMEYLPFAGSPPDPAREPDGVTEFMNVLECHIHDAMQDLLSTCHTALRRSYYRRVESGWLRSWPLQLCLKSAELQHTLHTRNALVQCSLLGKKKPLKMLRALHTKLLQELTASACIENEQWQSKKLNDLLVLELNARDLIERLCRRKELHGLESFEWISQLHSYWNPSDRKCFMQLLNVRFTYGYECKRSTEPMLLTPVSERARMATICALKSRQIPLLLSTSGGCSGRQVLLQSLAYSLGRFLITIECDESCLVENLMRINTYKGSLTDEEMQQCYRSLCLVYGAFDDSNSQPTDQELIEMVRNRSKALNFKLSDSMIDKVLLLHQSLLAGGRPILVTGMSGSGKSACIDIALGIMKPAYESVRLIPNTLRKSSKPRIFDREWLDSIIQTSLLPPSGSECIGRKCLIFDSVPCSEWIDCVAQLARPGHYMSNDFTQITTAGPDRDVKVIVECVGPLHTMTPSSVSHFAVVHIGNDDLGWMDVVEVWLEQKPQILLREKLHELVTKNMQSFLAFRRHECQTIATVCDVSLVRTFCQLCDSLLAPFDMSKILRSESGPTTLQLWSDALVKVFFFCAVWSIGGSMDDEGSRSKYDLLLREQHPEAGYPLKGNVYQFYVDLPEGTWRSWDTKLLSQIPTVGTSERTVTGDSRNIYRGAYIRSPHTIAYEFLVKALMRDGAPVLVATVQSLLNKCHLLVMTPPAEEQLGQIFTDMILSALVEPAKHGPVLRLLAPATVDFVGRLTRRLPPTPTRLRYQFSLQTIASIVRSVCHCLGSDSRDAYLSEKAQLLRLWIHECYRESWDRLERTDHRRFYELLNETVSGHFEVTLHGLCPNNQSPIFTDMMHGKSSRNPYEDVRDFNQLITNVEERWNEVSDDSTKNLIIHREAIEHSTKVLRSIRLNRSGMILMGHPGGGRTVACQLAARLSSYKPITLHRLNAKARDEPEAIESEFSRLFQVCLVQQGMVLVLVNLDDIVEAEPNERLMELLGGIITGEEFGVLFCENTPNGQKPHPTEGTDDTGAIDWQKVRTNLHFVLCLPLEVAAFRIILQRYPSLARDLTVDCMHDWPEASLLEISKKYLLKNVPLNVPIQGAEADSSAKKARRRESLVQSTEERLQIATHDLLFRIHYAVQTEATLPTAAKRNIIAPCSWYFELLDTFERVLREKRLELQALHRKFRVGIERIEDATLKVAKLSEELEERQQEIALFQEQLDEFLEEIGRQTKEADEQTEEVSVKRVKIGAEEVVCKQLAEVAGADLQRAMPALNAAVAALDSLNKKDMNEIKSYSRPPTKVELVMEAVMILLGKEPTWVESKRQLGEQKFLDTLKGFDRNNISEKTLKTIGAYVRNPELEPDKVGTVSKAAKSLMLWVRAIENYGKVFKFVGPKIRKMEDANASLLEKQNELAAAERKLIELAEKLAQLRAEYDAKIAEKQLLEETARQMAMKLKRARNLVDNLAGERIRWLATKNELEANYAKLIGDTLLAAGFLTYLGPVNIETRTNFLGQWLIDLETLEMPFTRQFSLTAYFYDPGVLIRWHENGLPPDDFSAENATILMKSTRVALIIDPQEEAQKWLIAELEGRVKLVDFDDEICESTLVESFEQHEPLMVENINRRNVNQLDELFTLRDTVSASCERCHEKNQSSDVAHPLYLVGQESLRMSGALVKRVNQLSFVLGAEGLEMKMLGLLVQSENPSLEERKEQLQQTILHNKKTLVDLEEQILRILNESKIPLLEDEELYHVLETSRATFETVSSGLQQAEHTRLEIQNSREVYRSCAARSALLFLVLGDLQLFNRLYRYSLEWYRALFLLSLERSGRVQQVTERKRRIDDYHTFNVFRDCHLSEKFLKQLPHVVAFLKRNNLNSKFRLWLSSKPHEALPLSVLQNCIKLAYEEPKGIKHHMGNLYDEIGETRFKKSTAAMKQSSTNDGTAEAHFKRLLFTMAFLHGLLLERNNFQQLGWIESYQCVNNDFCLAESLLSHGMQKLLVKKVSDPRHHHRGKGGLTNAKASSADVSLEDDFQGLDQGEDEQRHDATPWQFIKGAALELCYGAQIASYWDRRIYEIYLEELFHPQLLTPMTVAPPSPPGRGWFRLPRDGLYQTYVEFIGTQLPDRDGIDVFGQHENANIKYLKSRSDYMLQMLTRVAKDPSQQQQQQHDVGQDHERTKQTILGLLSTLPVYLDYENALRIVGAGANRTSVSDALLAEVRTYNAILTRVQSDCRCLVRMLTGATNELLDEDTGRWSVLLRALQINKVPKSWATNDEAVARSCVAAIRMSLSDWILQLRERIQYFRRWTETGQLPVEILLGRFTDPRRFLNGVLQHHAKVYGIPFEELRWDFTIYSTNKPLERISIQDGFIAWGFRLENGSWDWEKQTLALPDILEMTCPMPPVAFRPIRRITDMGEISESLPFYQCPVFYSSDRSEDIFVLVLPLPTGEQQSEQGWNLFNTALLLND
uniref:Sulfotransferase domain-containing protein n=1 Tax=Anopheles minimus TaxID=112268 RepID=A0A182VV30_9DIPT